MACSYDLDIFGSFQNEFDDVEELHRIGDSNLPKSKMCPSWVAPGGMNIRFDLEPLPEKRPTGTHHGWFERSPEWMYSSSTCTSCRSEIGDGLEVVFVVLEYRNVSEGYVCDFEIWTSRDSGQHWR